MICNWFLSCQVRVDPASLVLVSSIYVIEMFDWLLLLAIDANS